MEDNQVQAPDQAALGGQDTPATPDTQPEQVETPKTFTQDDVSGLVAKETKKAQEKLLKILGVTDFNSAKEGLQKYNEMIESQKTDQQRKEEELATYQTKYQQEQERALTLESKLAALELSVNKDYLDDVLLLAKAKGGEDIKQSIAEVLERHPHFTTQPAQEDTSAPRFTTGAHKKDSPETDDFVKALFGKK